PVRDPYGQGMDDDLRDVAQMSGGHVGHAHLPALVSTSSVNCSPADLSAAFACADRRKAMKGCVFMAGSRACATTYSMGGRSSAGSGTISLKPAAASGAETIPSRALLAASRLTTPAELSATATLLSASSTPIPILRSRSNA